MFLVRHYCLVCEREQECTVECETHRTTSCPPDCKRREEDALYEAVCTMCGSRLPPGGLTDELAGTPWEW